MNFSSIFSQALRLTCRGDPSVGPGRSVGRPGGRTVGWSVSQSGGQSGGRVAGRPRGGRSGGQAGERAVGRSIGRSGSVGADDPELKWRAGGRTVGQDHGPSYEASVKGALIVPNIDQSQIRPDTDIGPSSQPFGPRPTKPRMASTQAGTEQPRPTDDGRLTTDDQRRRRLTTGTSKTCGNNDLRKCDYALAAPDDAAIEHHPILRRRVEVWGTRRSQAAPATLEFRLGGP